MKKIDFFDFLFILFLSCIVVSNIIWFKIDNTIIGNDSGRHLLFSVDFFYRFSDIIHSNAGIFNKLSNVIHVIGTGPLAWPQGLSLTAFISYSLLGRSLFAAKMTLLPYLIILLFSTYSIGRLLSSKFAGFIAAFLLFFYPIIFQSSRQYQLDLPLTALVTFIIYLLLKIDQFNDTKYCLILGIVSGFSMLIKGQTALFVTCPFLYMLFRARPFKPKQLRNLFIALTLSVLIASIWWGPRINQVLPHLKWHIIDPAMNFCGNTPFDWDKKYSLESIFFHLWALCYSSLRPFFALLLIIALTLFLRQKMTYKGLFISWIIPAFLLISLVFTVKHSRFLMPILPALALISSFGLTNLQNIRARLIILTISIIFSFLQFYVLSFGNHKDRLVSIGRFRIFGENGFGSYYETGEPHKEDLKVDDLVRIVKNNNTFGHTPRILIIDLSKSSSDYSKIAFWLKIKDHSLALVNLVELFYLSGRLDSVDFVINRTLPGNPANWFEVVKYINASSSDYFNELKGFEIRIKRLGKKEEWDDFLRSLKDGSYNFYLIDKVTQGEIEYYIYKKRVAVR